MINPESIENLKNRLDIVEVVGSYIELKKSGANFKARCPFHSEDTPSFVVSPSKQIYHCFGCGAGGDSIKFVMEYEKLNYPEALEKLANDFNVELTYSKNDFEKKDEKKVLEQVNLFFKRNLNANKVAKDYLKQRGIYESSIEKFGIGYAPGSKETLFFLSQNFLSQDDALKAGLLGIGENHSIYSRFIERITFPIYAPNGKIVGFGGRTISNHPAKYINSPQTVFFNKSKLLYGYNLAKNSILKTGRIIITEGYLDTIMLHQAGFSESVATLGTALTKEHLPLLRRAEPKVILSYDGDSAGVAAALKASKMLGSLSISGGVVVFENGKDPADMVQNGEINELNMLFKEPKAFIPFVIEQITKQYDINDPLEKEKALKENVEFLKTVPSLLQDEYKEYLSVILGIDKRIIRFKNIKKPIFLKSQKEDLAELSIIKTLSIHPEFLDLVLDLVDEKVFNTHKREFALLVKEGTTHPYFGGLLIRDDIGELSEDELKNQLCFLLLGYYKISLDKIKNRKDLAFERKSFYIRKIQDKLQKLKKGELTVYEKF